MSSDIKFKQAAQAIYQDHQRMAQALRFVADGARIPQMTVFCDGKGCKDYHHVPVPLEATSLREVIALAVRESRRLGWSVKASDGGMTLEDGATYCPACRDEQEEGI